MRHFGSQLYQVSSLNRQVVLNLANGQLGKLKSPPVATKKEWAESPKHIAVGSLNLKDHYLVGLLKNGELATAKRHLGAKVVLQGISHRAHGLGYHLHKNEQLMLKRKLLAGADNNLWEIPKLLHRLPVELEVCGNGRKKSRR